MTDDAQARVEALLAPLNLLCRMGAPHYCPNCDNTWDTGKVRTLVFDLVQQIESLRAELDVAVEASDKEEIELQERIARKSGLISDLTTACANLQRQLQEAQQERDGFRADLEQLEKIHREFVDDLRRHIVIAPEDVEGLLARFGLETKQRAEAAEAQCATQAAQLKELRAIITHYEMIALATPPKEQLMTHRFTQYHEWEVLECMEHYGGSFIQALVECYHAADNDNRRILLTGFAHYFAEYEEMVARMKPTERT